MKVEGSLDILPELSPDILRNTKYNIEFRFLSGTVIEVCTILI